MNTKFRVTHSMSDWRPDKILFDGIIKKEAMIEMLGNLAFRATSMELNHDQETYIFSEPYQRADGGISFRELILEIKKVSDDTPSELFIG